MIYTLTLNPSIDQHITVKKLTKDDKIKAIDIRRDPGGKGVNVSRVVNELGGKTKAFGLVGGCAGTLFHDLLLKYKIDYQFSDIKDETRINVILTDLSDKSQTRISAPGPKITSIELKNFLRTIKEAKRPTYWVLGGSLPRGVPQDTYKKIIHYFQSRGEKCVLDSDEESLRLGIEANPFLIKPNEFEFARLVGKNCTTNQEFLKEAQKLLKRVEVVAISLGKKGAIVVTKNKAWYLKGPSNIKVQSKVGAGDSFIAGLLTALDKGETLDVAVRWAVASGTAAVMREGTKLCRKEDVYRMLKSIILKAL